MIQTDSYWIALLYVRNGGRLIESRVGPAREMLNVAFPVQPFALPRRRKMRRELGYMELCQFLTGAFSTDEIGRVAPNVDMSLFGDSAIYGPRVFGHGDDRYGWYDQLAEVIEELRRFPNSRRAIITVANSHEAIHGQPCLTSLQFQVRAGALYTTAHFRSWDLWFGAPHDLIVVSGIAQVVASCVGFPLSAASVGSISCFAANAHIYEKSLADAGGPALGWYFEMPAFDGLGHYRAWALSAREAQDWIKGPPPGMWYESFPRVPPLLVAQPLDI